MELSFEGELVDGRYQRADERVPVSYDDAARDLRHDAKSSRTLVGLVVLVELIKEHGASQGLRRFSSLFDIPLKDKNLSTAKTHSRVLKKLDFSARKPYEEIYWNISQDGEIRPGALSRSA